MTQQEMHIALCEWMGVECMETMSMEEYARAAKMSQEVRFPKYTIPTLPPLTLDWLHECEKELNDKQQTWYLQKLTQVRFKQGVGGMIDRMIDKTTFATKEQRLEALCRTLFPERFKG